MAIIEPPAKPKSSASRLALYAAALVSLIAIGWAYLVLLASVAVEPQLTITLYAYHVVDRTRTTGTAPFRGFLESFVRDGSPQHVNATWEWLECSPEEFFRDLLTMPLVAGTVVVIDNVMMLREADSGNVSHAYERPKSMITTSFRLWDLLNATEPLVVIFANGDGGTCDTPWPSNTHHMLYRTEWCDSYHDEWLASVEAERTTGPTAGWLRAIPFGVGPTASRDLGALSASRTPIDERPLLFSYRGPLGVRKPSRSALYAHVQEHAAELDALASKLLAGAPAHPLNAVGHFLVEVSGPGAPLSYGAAAPSDGLMAEGQSAHAETLRQSRFVLVPPGDQWEDYRIYEAIEAGAIPVVINNATYKHCSQPAKHLLATTPGVLALDSWDELPAALSAAHRGLARRQRAMLEWLAREKRSLARDLFEVVTRMRSGRWRERTTCDYQYLNAYEVAQQHKDLAKYWRKPQPRFDTPWNATAFWAYMTSQCVGSDAGWCEDQVDGGEYTGSIGRRFLGPGGFCESGSEDWTERCLTEGCALDLIHSFECRPTRLPHIPRPVW